MKVKLIQILHVIINPTTSIRRCHTQIQELFTRQDYTFLPVKNQPMRLYKELNAIFEALFPIYRSSFKDVMKNGHEWREIWKTFLKRFFSVRIQILPLLPSLLITNKALEMYCKDWKMYLESKFLGEGRIIKKRKSFDTLKKSLDSRIFWNWDLCVCVLYVWVFLNRIFVSIFHGVPPQDLSKNFL